MAKSLNWFIRWSFPAPFIIHTRVSCTFNIDNDLTIHGAMTSAWMVLFHLNPMYSSVNTHRWFCVNVRVFYNSTHTKNKTDCDKIKIQDMLIWPRALLLYYAWSAYVYTYAGQLKIAQVSLRLAKIWKFATQTHLIYGAPCWCMKYTTYNIDVIIVEDFRSHQNSAFSTSAQTLADETDVSLSVNSRERE